MTEPTAKAKVERLADELIGGCNADIWYDADDYGDDAKSNQIDDAREAMNVSSELLRILLSEPELPASVEAFLEGKKLDFHECEEEDETPTYG